MITSYQYKLLPNYAQRIELVRWLDMLRCQYNYLLSDRFDWWEMNRCAANACPLTCSIAEVREQPNYYSQKRTLPILKGERPWYKEIQSQVLQDMVKRVDLAFARFIEGDKNGKRSGRPRFKGKHRYRTMAFPQLKAECIAGNRITLPKLGAFKFRQHRPIPDGFVVKRALVTLKADSWYITLTLEDQTVPKLPPVETVPNEENSLGVDAGLEYFMSASDKTQIEPPKFYRKAEQRLGLLQAKREAKAKGSKSRRKLNVRIAKLHQRIARQRRQFHFETANELLAKADVVFVEKLKVGNMARRCKPKQADSGEFLPNGQAAKSGLNKSFADAGIAGFLNEILPYKAEKAGKRIIQVNPAGTSQHCAMCLNRVPKGLGDRWHDCSHCGYAALRDINSAILIKKVGLGVSPTLKRESKSKA